MCIRDRGTTLPGNFKIKKVIIRGEDSFGMICSEKELQISDEHEGIMVLPENLELGKGASKWCSGSSRGRVQMDPGGPLAPETHPLFAPRAAQERTIHVFGRPWHPLVLFPRRF